MRKLGERVLAGVAILWVACVLSHVVAGWIAFEEDIRQAILIIMQTDPGERVMRPDFGAGLNALVFEPVNTTTMALVKHRVEQALILWEPRINLIDVTVTTDENERNRLLISVSYQVRSTNTFYNLVYPFYLLEGEQQ